MNRNLLGFGGLGIALLLLLSINVLAGATLTSARVDLTKEKLFTLSEGSKAVLSKLDEPVTVRLFFSKKLAKEFPPLPNYAQRVEELLGEYESRAGGNLRIETYDPEPFSEIEDEAVRYGLSGVPLPGGAGTLYFGLVGTNSVDDVEVIPFLQPDRESFLEYDLTKLVYGLANPERATVGVLAGLPIEGQMANPYQSQQQMPQPWLVLEQVRQLYETRTLQPNLTEVPPEVDVLMLVHPKSLPDSALYAVDQFVLRGGKLLAFVDPYCEVDVPPTDPNNPMQAMMAPRASTLGPLFDAWGVRLVDGQLAGDLRSALQVTIPGRTGRQESVSYVAWMALEGDSISTDEVVTDGLSILQLRTPGILEPTENAATEFTPLIWTSQESEQIPVTQVQFGPDPAGLLASFFSPDRPAIPRSFTLAARIAGTVSSAFPAGKPAAPTAEGQEPPPVDDGTHLAQSQGPINVIVVADCDMLADQCWARPINFGGQRLISKSADNGDLVINALDFLGGSTDLISLRGRGDSSRPFTVVQDLQRKAEALFRVEERALLDEQQRVEQKLNDLLTQQEGTGSILITPEVEAEIVNLREERAKTNANLRRVRHNLSKDVEALGARIKWINIAAIPLLVGLSAAGLAGFRSRKRRNS